MTFLNWRSASMISRARSCVGAGSVELASGPSHCRGALARPCLVGLTPGRDPAKVFSSRRVGALVLQRGQNFVCQPL